MCRLFAQISPEAASAEKFLVSGRRSLLKLSNKDKNRLQKDGWGIGYFNDGDKPVVLKSPKAAFREPKKFATAAALAHSRTVIGHIRAASNPKGLAVKSLISKSNSQPFTDGRWIFAHNGTLEIPDLVAEHLGPLAKNIKSHNDSEVYFWQFIKHYRKTRSAVKALQACVKEDWSLWSKFRDRYPKKSRPYTSLNVLIGDGKTLYAFCHSVKNPDHDPTAPVSHALCSISQPWTTMSWNRRGRQVVVASEDMDKSSWSRFKNGDILVATLSKGKVAVEHAALGPLPEAA